jgi:hypothetical protein
VYTFVMAYQQPRAYGSIHPRRSQIHIRVTDEKLQAYQAAALKENEGLSLWICNLLDAELDRQAELAAQEAEANPDGALPGQEPLPFDGKKWAKAARRSIATRPTAAAIAAAGELGASRPPLPHGARRIPASETAAAIAKEPRLGIGCVKCGAISGSKCIGKNGKRCAPHKIRSLVRAQRAAEGLCMGGCGLRAGYCCC